MSDSAIALPCRLIGVREGMGPELLPTVLFSLVLHGLVQPSLRLRRVHLATADRASCNLLIVLLGLSASAQEDS